MINLDEIIKNEVIDALGRNPEPDELAGFMEEIREYLEINDKKKIFLVDIARVIEDHRHDNYHQCEMCGEWLRMDDESLWNSDFGWVCRECEHFYEPEAWLGR
jgi:formylmethanofuran dehydrogenase subunit E